MTTINPPNLAAEKLSKCKGWTLLVVGDKKTPTDWDNFPCIYLGPEEQEKENFKINQFIPWNNYCRKNIGYLYAIKHGAKVIYETDDDTFIYNNDLNFEENLQATELKNDDFCLNVFNYFGCETSWPRGYPLSKIKNTNQYSESKSKSYCCPIQSSLVDNDPDVDAIYRLTNKGAVNFEKNKTVVLEKGTMCPFNTQNTFIHYKAFWSLLIPLSCSYRATDIWRGFWAQRLLWEMNCRLCFTSPIAYQLRNEHNFLEDFKQELSIYLQAESLIKELNNWKPKEKELPKKIIELTKFMVEKDFLTDLDNKFVEAWIEDLKNLGYSFPQ